MANKTAFSLLVLVALISIGFVGAPPVVAKGKSPEIISVQLDYTAGIVTVFADNLSDGLTAPTISLDDVVLGLGFWDEMQADAVADIGSFVPGDYLLIVDSNFKKAKPVEMMLTLGAVGPQGEPGPQGDTGLPGPPADLDPIVELYEELEDRIAALEAATGSTLKLIKHVINDDGGTATVGDFALHIDAQPVTSGIVTPVLPGGHTASEQNLAGYTASPWSGDCAADGLVTIAAGENKVCYITNDDTP